VFDYKSNRAAAAEGAYVTVVGSPTAAWERDANRATTATNERLGLSGKKRHNVYIAWLTPRTKICEGDNDSGRTGQAASPSQSQKKEVSLDQLEIGDHVEIAFNREDPSASNRAHLTEPMRQKHGRHRMYVGTAAAVTILGYPEHEQHATGAERTSTGRSR
jgi:hypothetical protein